MLHGQMRSIAGVRVHFSENAMGIVQTKFPRSKKKRIRKKWSKNKTNYEYRPCIYYMDGLGMVCHPLLKNSIIDRLR